MVGQTEPRPLPSNENSPTQKQSWCLRVDIVVMHKVDLGAVPSMLSSRDMEEYEAHTSLPEVTR